MCFELVSDFELRISDLPWCGYSDLFRNAIWRRGLRLATILCLAQVSSKDLKMRNLTAIIHKADPDEGGYWATCIEVPGANGQGETRQECLENLKEAVRLLLEVEREEALRCDPKGEEVPIAI